METAPQLKILRRKAVERKTGLSRSTIYAWIIAGKFPKAVQLGGHRVGWLESEVNDWLYERAKNRSKV